MLPLIAHGRRKSKNGKEEKIRPQIDKGLSEKKNEKGTVNMVMVITTRK
jgi:hypothetical protein